MPFAPGMAMSKQNDVNPGQYYDGDRNHQGEGIVQEEHKQKLKEQQKSEGKQGQQGQPNYIPGEAPAGEKSSK